MERLAEVQDFVLAKLERIANYCWKDWPYNGGEGRTNHDTVITAYTVHSWGRTNMMVITLLFILFSWFDWSGLLHASCANGKALVIKRISFLPSLALKKELVVTVK